MKTSMLSIEPFHEHSSETNVILFLDYDGVLHFDFVYRRFDGRIELHTSIFPWKMSSADFHHVESLS